MKKGWIIAGAILGCTMGASLGACSSTATSTSSGTTTHPTGTTSTATGTTSTSATNTGGTTTTSGTTSMTGTGGTTTTTSGTGNCSTVGTLHPPKLDAGANVYCPFSGVDGGENVYCTGGTQHCCETPADAGMPSSCQPIATACPNNDTDWACEDPVADCTDPANPVCCAPGASIGLGTPGCGNFAHTMKNTVCVASQAACSGIIMCTNNNECPSGQTCTPFSKAGNQVGGCM